MSRLGRTSLLVLTALLVTLPVAAETYTCVCESLCGNGGIGAERGKVMTGVQRSRLRDWYGLSGPGHSSRTGWTCMVEQSYSCTCAAAGCGNGARGGSRGDVGRNVSAEDAIKRYGAMRSGETGWQCVPAGSAGGSTTVPVRASVDVSGDWTDLDGRSIRIAQTGSRVNVTMLSREGQRWWTDARGTISGSQIQLDHRLGGRVTDRQSGTVRGHRIDWANGTTWRRTAGRPDPPPPPPASTVDVGGWWTDLDGRSIRIEQAGSRVTATMTTREGQRWWTDARGTVTGDRIELAHRKDGQVTDRQSGRVRGRPGGGDHADRIDWGNDTTWRRRSPPRHDDPIPDPVLADVEGTWTDSNGHSIRIEQSGSSVTATMLAGAGRQWWTDARGSVTRDRIELEHRRGSTVTDRQSGTISQRRIDWANGSYWSRGGAVIGGYPSGHDPTGGRPDDVDVSLTCSSRDKKRVTCPAPGRVLSVTLSDQKSRSACVEGTSWGHDADGVWVDEGCRAVFRVRVDGRTYQPSGEPQRGRSDDPLVAILQAVTGQTPDPPPEPVQRDDPFEPAYPVPPGGHPDDPPRSVDLSGRWLDSNGNSIRVEQSGSWVTASMVSAEGQRWWTDASGTLRGDHLDLEHQRGSRVTDTQHGTVVGWRRIEWSNGSSWTRERRRGRGPDLTDGWYQIRVKATGRHLHVDGLGDGLASTRHQADDDYTRFRFDRQPDGSDAIRVQATGRYLHVDGRGDRLVSTRGRLRDDYSRFLLERQRDGSHRIRVKADGRILHVDGLGDQLLSTRHQADDDYTRFWIER